MSDNLDIRATITAVDNASPTISKLLANIKRLESAAKSFSASFGNAGRSGMATMAGFDRTIKAAAAQMQGLANVSQSTARSYATDWNRVNSQRLSEARAMYASLMREERQYQALVSKRGASHGSGTSVRKIAGGTFLGVGAASATHQLGHSVVAAEKSIGRGIAAAFRERLKVSKAETGAEMFGDLTGAEVKKLRKDYLDKLGIKFGTGSTGALGVSSELAKAGLDKKILGDATELALKAKMALDVSEQETAKLFGGLASFIQFDKARYASIANSIAVANKSSKASGTEIVEGMKRGLSAIATTGGKLTPEQLAGLVGTAIDVGIQPGKSGNFISHLVGTVGSADTAHGKRAKNLQEAAQHLGFGGRQEMAQAMRNNPLESIYKILDGLAKLPEKMKIRVAKDLGQEMWFDEILQMVLAKDKLKSMEKDIATDTGFLDKAALRAVRSMGGTHTSVVATAKLAQEKMGDGFDKAFTQIFDAILRHADTFNFDSITNHVSAFVDGLRQGFGFKDWGQAVDWLVSKFDSGTTEVWKSWGRGFASGIKSWGESLASAFNIVRRLIGTGNDAESTGKLVANLAALATSLIVVNPMLLLLAGTMALLSSPFATFIASVIALKKVLDWVADKMFAAFVSIVDAIKNVALTMINKVRGWIGLNPIEGSGPSRKPGESQKEFQKRIDDYTLERLKQPTSYSGATDFSGRRRSADLPESFTKFAGKIERAASMSAGIGGSQYAAIGGGFSYASQRKGFNATPLHHAVPGQKLPSFGLGSNGIIKRSSIPNFNGTGGSIAGGLSRSAFERKFAGTPLGGKYDQIVGAAKANGIDPLLLAGVIAHETGNGLVLSGNNPGGVMDPATGMARKMKFSGLDDGFSKTAQVVAKNYRRAGGDLDQMGNIYAPPGAANDPRGLNGGWPAGVRKNMQQMSGSSPAGSGGTGDAVAYAEGFKGMNEYSHNRILASALGGDVRGRSNAWCARFVNRALAAAGGKGTGSAVANSFQRYGSAVKPSDVKRNDVLLETNDKGYNQTGGHVGLATGETRTRNGRMQIKMISGNDSDSVRERWINADDPGLMVRRGNGPQGVASQVPSQSLIQNVPAAQTPIRGDASLGLQRGGPVAIHINGNSHDPEALATLVQRRIDESMNWRTHDTASEYT